MDDQIPHPQVERLDEGVERRGGHQFVGGEHDPQMLPHPVEEAVAVVVALRQPDLQVHLAAAASSGAGLQMPRQTSALPAASSARITANCAATSTGPAGTRVWLIVAAPHRRR